jgi:AraC-like DNA-binding protein
MAQAIARGAEMGAFDRHCLFRRADLGEARERVALAFKPHRIVAEGPVCADMARIDLGAVSLNLLDYGAAVRVDPGHFDRFLIVQFPLRGLAEVQIGRERYTFGPGEGVVLEPARKINLRLSLDCRQLLIQLRRDVLNRVAERMFGRPAPATFGFQVPLALSGSSGIAWQGLVRYLLAHGASPPLAAMPPQDYFAEMVASHLLSWQPHQVSAEAARATPLPRHVKRAEDMMRQPTGQLATLADLAAHAGVSVRTLTDGFRRFRAASPMQWQRDLRLDQARADLIAGICGVTEAATKYGFFHLGRFAESYRRRFGERPSDTLRRR